MNGFGLLVALAAAEEPADQQAQRRHNDHQQHAQDLDLDAFEGELASIPLIRTALSRLHDVTKDDAEERQPDESGVGEDVPEGLIHQPAEERREDLEEAVDAHER